MHTHATEAKGAAQGFLGRKALSPLFLTAIVRPIQLPIVKAHTLTSATARPRRPVWSHAPAASDPQSGADPMLERRHARALGHAPGRITPQSG